MTGPDVEEAQKLLAKNPFGNFPAGTPDGDYGEVTAAAVQRAKLALGYPDAAVNGVFGDMLRAFLGGKKPLPADYKARAKKRQAPAASSEDKIRAKILEWALWGVANNARIAYSQGQVAALGARYAGDAPARDRLLRLLHPLLQLGEGAEPELARPLQGAMGGYTGTMLKHLKPVPPSGAKIGDLIVWTPPATGAHVVMLASTGPNPWVVSHGSDSGPAKLRFSDEDAYQRSQGHGTPVFLSAF